MTSRSFTERDLTEWIQTTWQPVMPDYVDDLLARTARARQRPAWIFPERWIPMNVTAQAPSIIGRRVPLRTMAVVALLLLAIAVGAVLISGSQRRLPAPYGPAANGLIAYVEPAGDTQILNGYAFIVPHGDIFTVDPVSGVPNALVVGPSSDGYPVYSLDGTRLAFVRDVDGGQMLYVIDAQGGEPRLLTKEPLPNIADQVWSPDGSSVAFTSLEGDRSHLWIAATDGHGAKRVPMDPELSVGLPQWRPPDGRELLVVGSTFPELLPGSGYQDLWGGTAQPTGTGIGLYLTSPDGSGLRPITPADGQGYDYSHLRWTPLGDRIVTQRTDPLNEGYLRVRVLTADGAEVTVIEPTTGVETMAPIVSPDGLRVAYADMTASESWRLRIVSIDGSSAPVETDATFTGGAAAYRWSPDGRTIVVTHHFRKETWLVDAISGEARRAPWTDPGYPAWQRVAP